MQIADRHQGRLFNALVQDVKCRWTGIDRVWRRAAGLRSENFGRSCGQPIRTNGDAQNSNPPVSPGKPLQDVTREFLGRDWHYCSARIVCSFVPTAIRFQAPDEDSEP